MSRHAISTVRFPELIHLLTDNVPDLISAEDEEKILFFHELRNLLYHETDVLSVRKEDVRNYITVACNLFRTLFAVEIDFAEPASETKIAVDSYGSLGYYREVLGVDEVYDLSKHVLISSRENVLDLVEEAKRDSNYVSIVMLDVDDFKSINDKWGHAAGDRVLHELEGRLRQEVVGKGRILRYGGDEFLVIMPGLRAQDAKVLAERIADRIKEPVRALETHDCRVTLTVSAGIAEYPRDATNPTELVSKADRAIHVAKKGGKNRVVVAGNDESG